MLNVEKTMIRILISLALSIVATIAHAQTWTQLQWGVNKSSGYPYSICMNISGSWSCIGSVNSGGVFSANVSSMPAFTGGDCTSTAGSVALSCTKTGGVSFGYFATGTDASNLTGTVAAARMPAFTGGDVTSSAGSVILNAKPGGKSLAFTGVASQWPWQLNVDGTWTLKQPALSDMAALPTPTWASGSSTYHYNGFANGISTIPDSAKFGYAYGPVVEAQSWSVDVPGGSTAIHTSTIAAYMRARGAPAGVALLGAGLVSADAVNGSWALNTVSTNGPTTQPVTKTGFNFGFLGVEFDTNVMKLASGAAPTGNAYGLYLAGQSEVAPIGNYSAILVDQLGLAANIPWSSALLIADGGSNYGVWHGTTAKGTNNVGSIPDIFIGRDSGGVIHQASIAANALGDLVLTPSSGRMVTINGGLALGVVTTNAQFVVDAGVQFASSGGFSAATAGAAMFKSGTTLYLDNYDGGIQVRGTGNTSLLALDQSGKITQATWNGVVVGVAYGGTGCSVASGSCLDAITGFSDTGYMQRTGAGAYSFSATIPASALAGTSNITMNNGLGLTVADATNNYTPGSHGNSVFGSGGSLYLDSYSGTINFRGAAYVSLGSIDASGNYTSPGYVKTGAVGVASLPACNAGLKGARHFVTNANATTFASTVAAGGTNNVPVVCNGTNWIIG